METKKRRQVSFNTDDEIYTAYKKLMVLEGRTPTGDLNRYIRQPVEKARQEGLLQ